MSAVDNFLVLIGQEIRATHPYAYRSGEWARITDIQFMKPGIDSEPRWVYVVEYEDGKTDKTPIHNSGYEYEFRINGEVTKNA